MCPVGQGQMAGWAWTDPGVAIHEIDHAGEAHLVGSRLVPPPVGPCQLRRTSTGLRFGLNDAWRLLAKGAVRN